MDVSLMICTKCHQKLSSDSFYARRMANAKWHLKSGPMQPCKRCHDRQTKAYGKTTRGKIARKRYQMQYDQSERGKAKYRRYRQTEKRKVVLQRYADSPQGRQYIQSIPKLDSSKRAQKKYRHSTRGRAMLVAASAKRRALIRFSPTALTTNEWRDIVTAANARCHYCKQPVEKLTMEHVIPISKGGPHTKDNIVAACGPCNYKKQAKLVLDASQWRPRNHST